MANPNYKRRPVLWGAYRFKAPKQRSGSGQTVKSGGVYSSVIQGVVDRINLIKNVLKPPKAYALRGRPAGSRRREGQQSTETPINPVRNRKKKGEYTYLWVPKVQDRFSRYVFVAGQRDYRDMLSGKLSPSNAKWSRLGIPRPLSQARHVANLCKYSQTGAFRLNGKVFLLDGTSKRNLGGKKKLPGAVDKVDSGKEPKLPNEV